MARRVVLAALASAALMFLWGFVFWGPVINATARLMAPLPADAELDAVAPLRRAQVPDGMYVYPGPLAGGSDQAAIDAWTAKIQEGPVFHLAYHQQGVSPMEPMMFIKGLVHNFAIALLSAILLATVVDSLPRYAGRVGFRVLLTLIAAIWTNVGSVIWWFHTPQYCAGQMAYEIVAGLLMALVTAALIKPKPIVL